MGYSNSSLVSYTKLSPNYESRNGKKIKYIIPHCMAGNCSVETCGEIFASPSREASSNYGIGSDGRIALYVPEEYRAWTTGGNRKYNGIGGGDLDYEAVTIEVANDSGSPDWHISDKALESLVALCADICIRNGISSLRWEDNPELVGNSDAQNMAAHRWFAAKACLPVDETELLTKKGWVSLANIKIGDEIATANKDDLSISFSPVLDMVEKRIENVFKFSDITATKDHRILYYDEEKNPKIDHFNELWDYNNEYSIPSAGYYNSKGISLNNTFSELSTDEIKLIVAIHYLGTLTYGNGKFTKISFILNNKKAVSKITNILDSIKCPLSIESQESEDKVTIGVYEEIALMIATKFFDEYGSLSWNLIDMNPSQAKTFINELMIWKSIISVSDNKYDYVTYNTNDRDVIITIAALNGIGVVYDNDSIIFDTLYRSYKNESSIGIIKNKEVSCVTVESGLILIRQGSRTTIVGNCPGDYMYNNFGHIADMVNAKIDNGDDVTNSTTVDESDNVESMIWNFLEDKGLNAFAIAGIMGNLYAESGLRSNNLQNSYERSLGYTDEEYTNAVDNGSYDNFVHDCAGYGLCQWTYWSRKENLLNFANERGDSIGDPRMQIEFFWKELQGYPNVLDVINNASSIREVSDVMITDFERPANQSESVKIKRAEYSQMYYDKFANSNNEDYSNDSAEESNNESSTSLPDTPFRAQVIIPDLNYRSEPSMDGVVKGQTGRGLFTITEVSDGWGKLKSGAGWIYLENPTYVTILESLAPKVDPEPVVEEKPKFPYKVKVDITDLNIRSGPGTDYKVTGQTGAGLFTIIDESDGTGASKWLKLKSGAGWISDDFVTHVE